MRCTGYEMARYKGTQANHLYEKSMHTLCLLHARGWLSRYTWDQQLYVVSEPRETHSPMLKARFLHLTNLVAQPGIEPPTSWLPGQRVTTRPRLSDQTIKHCTRYLHCNARQYTIDTYIIRIYFVNRAICCRWTGDRSEMQGKLFEWHLYLLTFCWLFTIPSIWIQAYYSLLIYIRC